MVEIKTKKMIVDIPITMDKKLKKISIERGMSKASIVKWAISELLIDITNSRGRFR